MDAWEVKNCLEHTCADQYIEEKEKEKEKKGMIWFRKREPRVRAPNSNTRFQPYDASLRSSEVLTKHNLASFLVMICLTINCVKDKL